MSVQTNTTIMNELKQGFKDYQRDIQRKWRQDNPDYYKEQYKKNAVKRRQYAREQYQKKKIQNPKDTLTDIILDNLANNLSAIISSR
jgi:hypothetical protein